MNRESDDHQSLISARQISRWFGKYQILAGVDLELPPGSVTALLGANGCGKSTLMRILAGLLPRHGGEVQVLGLDPERFGWREREDLALVVEGSSMPGSTRIATELKLRRRLFGRRWDARREAELMKRFELPANAQFGALSKGQMARLQLVMAVTPSPRLLMLDEPAAGLDLFARQDLLELVVEIVSDGQSGILIASHQIDDVERIADRVVFLLDGCAVVAGAVDDVRARFRRVHLQLASDSAAALEAAVAATADGRARLDRNSEIAPRERVLICKDTNDDEIAALASAGATRILSTRRLGLREVYMEVLGSKRREDADATAAREEVA